MFNLFNPQTYGIDAVSVSILHVRKLGHRLVRNLAKLTELVSRRAGIQTSVVWIWSWCALPLCCVYIPLVLVITKSCHHRCQYLHQIFCSSQLEAKYFMTLALSVVRPPAPSPLLPVYQPPPAFPSLPTWWPVTVHHFYYSLTLSSGAWLRCPGKIPTRDKSQISTSFDTCVA